MNESENENETDLSGDYDTLCKAVRKYRKKLRQIERLETTSKELSSEEKVKLMKRDLIRAKLQSLLAQVKFCEETKPVNNSDHGIPENDSFSSDQENFKEELQKATVTGQEMLDSGDFDRVMENEVYEKPVENFERNDETAGTAPQFPSQAKRKIRKPRSRLRKAWKNKSFHVSLLEGHNDMICDVAIDRNWIVSASRDTSIKLWDSSTCQEIRNLTGHSRTVTCVHLMDEATSDRLRGLVKVNRNELSCDLSQKLSDREQLVVSASSDCTIRLWLLPTGNLLNSIYNYSSVRSMCCCLGIVFVGSDSGKITIYSLISGDLLFERIICEEPITSLKCNSRDVVATTDLGQLFVWRVCDGEGKEIRVDENVRGEVTLKQTLSLRETELFVEGRQALSTCFHNEKLFVGDDGVNLKMIDLNSVNFTKFPNHFCGRAGFTDRMLVSNKLLFATAFDNDDGRGSINVRSLEDEDMFSYVATLTDSALARIVCADVDNNQQPISHPADGGGEALKFVTGGAQLLCWEEISPLNKQAIEKLKEEDEEVDSFTVKGSYVAELTRAAVDSDVDSDSSDDEDDENGAAAWFWTSRTQVKDEGDDGGYSEMEETSDDSDEESSSQDSETASHDHSWSSWCHIL